MWEMRCTVISYCILAVLYFNFISCSGTCHTDNPLYGVATLDFDLQVGSNLTMYCTINEGSLPGISRPVNSSDLSFRSDNTGEFFTNSKQIVNDRTAKLTLFNVQTKDSDVYHCRIKLKDRFEYVCSTNVNVGYPPKNVTNFKCISRNFDNLTCTWNIEPNPVRTEYILHKTVFLQSRVLQECPIPHNNTFCMWLDNSTPPYSTVASNLTFILNGTNSLGSFKNVYEYNHFEIVIPNPPEELKVVNSTKTSISIQWNAPTMRRVTIKPALYYQLWLEEQGPGAKDKIIVEAGVDVSNYTFEGLVPNYRYNISVRCRTNDTTEEDMWSYLTYLVIKTEPDVPYMIPEVNPEAYVIHNFGLYRNSTLFWKPIPERFQNGEGFYYHIKYFQIKEQESSHAPYHYDSKIPLAKIGYLHNDTAYVFHIHSANREGISENYTTIMIDERDKILPSAKDIRAISNGLGKYNLSWEKSGLLDSLNYTVFWCISRKPGHCEGPLQWTDGVLKDSTFSLNVDDVNSNFQFAVAATQNNRSSGMQWASCIVPVKAPLGQISISHIEPTSTTLRVMWKLDCEAQKSVIDRYVITYCWEGRDCKDAVAKSDVLSYTLKNLKPFSEYSVKLRAFNRENKPSEDVDKMFKRTLSAAPSDSPRNVAIISKSNSSFLVSWTPPLDPNGIITDYFIYHNGQKNSVGGSCKKCVFHVQGLKEYTAYNVSVEACVGSEDKNIYCSPKSPAVNVVTEVGAPGKMEAPRIETVNMTHLKVSWPAPSIRNGPIEFYEIHWKQEGGNETASQYLQEHSLSTLIDFACPNLLEGGLIYQFYVRAANRKNGSILFGPFSDPIKATTCVMSQGLAMIIGIAIGGTFAVAIFVLFLYKLFRWMSNKIHQVKNIAVRLPKELEGPETNPLNNYESFKNGLVKTVHNGKVDHLTYVVEESDNKNRHGSGSSQFSNSSTDELIFKNGKCTKFGRKPSGDSSGCSSMSSNTTTRLQLSSDSGTESDFMVPPSPDSLSNELHAQKPHMPILMEIHDSPEAASETLPKTVIDTHLDKYNLVSGMVLKVDHPYSKFGISGNVTSSIPCQINPLAFYSCSLANSEPSVFETQASDKQKTLGRSMYSKLGFAKSSGDILGRSKEMGYSKFGFPTECFSIDLENLNPIVSVALMGDQLLKSAVAEVEVTNIPTDLRLIDDEKKESSTVPNRSFPGYVQVGDIRGMKEADTVSSSSSLEDDDSSFEIPDLTSSDLSSVWTTGLFHLEPSDNLCFDKDQTLGGVTSEASPGNGFSNFAASSGVSVATGSVANDNYLDSRARCDVAPSLVLNNYNGHGSENRDTSSMPPEVLLNPRATGNGYVPFSTLSSMCDPVVSDSRMPLSIFNGGSAGADVDQNYITPSSKVEFKRLQEGLILNGKPFSPLLHCNGNKMRGPLKHALKPLPKMESEICEV